MAKSSLLRVMLSSRCNDYFPAGQTVTTLSSARSELKDEIERMEIAGKKAFEVWINERTPAQAATHDSWNVCVQAVKDCDILIVLSNGNAGWANSSGDIGICHAELMTGLSIAPAKVRLIALDPISTNSGAKGDRDRRFQTYVNQQTLFRGGTVKTAEDFRARVIEALHDAVIGLAQAGVREASKGKFFSGAALDWSRLNFAARQKQMVLVLKQSLLGHKQSRPARTALNAKDGGVFLRVHKHDILFVCHAIPAALSVGPARESVGQPFLRDHELALYLTEKKGGPVHIIACHKSATEAQAAKLLGFPDAILVTAPFGVFVADPIQKVQFAFVTNCRDESTTRHGVQRFLEWLNQTGEDVLLTDRALARARIVRAIAKESVAKATKVVTGRVK